MRNIILITALLSCLPFLAQAQYPSNPGKMRLGIQTTGQGLVFVTDTVPTWTPSNVANTWMALDTSANQLWCYANAAWGLCGGAGAGVDSLRFASDTLWVYQGGDSLGVEIIAGATLTAGSGIEIVGDSVNWNGPVTQPISIDFQTNPLVFENVGIGSYIEARGGFSIATVDPPDYSGDYSIISSDVGAYALMFAANDTEDYNSGVDVRKRRVLIYHNNNPAVISNSMGVDSLSVFIERGGSSSFRYRLAHTSPSPTLGDTTVMAWLGDGTAGNPIGFIPYGGGGGGGGPDQTLSASRDTVTISGTGNSIRTPGVGYLRDSVTTTTLTIDLKEYNQAIISIRMTSATSCTLTVNNPWAVLTDATAPSYEGQTGVYTFRFWDISGTDTVVWPAAFKDMGGTALGTDSLTAATIYTCYYDPVTSEYYCQ